MVLIGAFGPDRLSCRKIQIEKRLGNFEKAREEFRATLEIEPKQAAAYVQLGQTYEDQGFFEDARSSYQKAAELDYGNESIQTLLQDLEHHEEKAREIERQKEASRNYSTLRQHSWLMQELMKSR